MTVDRDPSWPWWRNWLWASVMPLAMVGVVVLFGVVIGVIPVPINDCVTTGKAELHNRAGLDFTVNETDCDADSAMSVFVAKTGGNEKTLLFKYDPVLWVPPPEIKVDRQARTILISVAMIEGTYSRLETWNGMSVKYDIWKPDDPRLKVLRILACPRGEKC
jgi:hypothetical protein